MKKLRLFIFVLLIISVSNSISLATETRLGSMGGVGFYTKDNSNIFKFPGSITFYGNQVISELRAKKNDNLYTIGVHFPLGSDNVFGLYLNRPINLTIPSVGANNVQLDRAMDLLLGFKFSSISLGFKLTTALDSYEREIGSDKVNESARYFALSAGLSSEAMDIGLTFDLPSIKWEFERRKDDWGGVGLQFNGRFFVPSKGDVQFVPIGVLYLLSTSREYDPGVSGVEKDQTDYGQINAALGFGINYRLTGNNLVVLGIEGIGISRFSMDVKDGIESTETTRTLPGFYLGVESNITSWLIGRLGAAQVFQNYSTTTKPQTGETITSSSYASQFRMTFGLGVVMGSFLLDASVNEGILFDGPNIISGSNEVLSNKLSITYTF